MPLHNKAEFVRDAVGSVLAQDFGDLELIVIDDGSTDGGGESLVDLGDSRVKVIRQSNSGASVARNIGITHATGRYIAFLDADDLWSRHHLGCMLELIDSDHGAIAWATGYTEFDPSCATPSSADLKRLCDVPSGTYDQYHFLTAWARFPFFWTGSITIRASTLHAQQPCFPVGERIGEDQDLWFRLSELGSIRYLNITGTAFYRRGVGNSLTASEVLAPLPAMLRLSNRNILPNSPVGKAIRRLVNLHMLHVAWANCIAGRRTTALRILFRSNPTSWPMYWSRILAGIIVPNAIVRVIIIRIKFAKMRRIDEL